MMADSTNKEMTHAAADALVDEQKGKAGGLVEDNKTPEKSQKMTPRVFLNKVLSGTALELLSASSPMLFYPAF